VRRGRPAFGGAGRARRHEAEGERSKDANRSYAEISREVERMLEEAAEADAAEEAPLGAARADELPEEHWANRSAYVTAEALSVSRSAPLGATGTHRWLTSVAAPVRSVACRVRDGSRGTSEGRHRGAVPRARRRPRTAARSGECPGRRRTSPCGCRSTRGWLGFEPKIADPHSPQNHFSPPPSGGFHIRSFSSPATIRKLPGAGCACADAAAPVRR
jgi:hypothetical protein